jgi:hypothetical protein
MRSLVLGSFLSALAVAGLCSHPSFAKDAGFDFWNVDELQQQKMTDQEKHQRMSRQNEIVLRRLDLREDVMKELLNEQISFEEATARFVEFNQTLPTKVGVAVTFPGKTEEDRAAWQLLSYLSSRRTPFAKALREEWECILTSRLAESNANVSSAVSE